MTWLLGLVLVWSYVFWLPVGGGQAWLVDRSSAICFPYLSFCRSVNPFQWLNFSQWNDLMGLLALATLVLVSTNYLRLAKLTLALGFLVKATLFLLDFRLMGNYHMIGFYFALLFFLRPSVSALQLMFTLVYFFAGLLKLNAEWLSGDALYGEIPGLNENSLVFATGFVVVLELLGSWLLLSKHELTRWTAWCFFIVFHALSVFVVGFFYPAVMISLLLFFPYCWQRNLSFDWPTLRRPATLAFFTLFLFVQFVPMSLKYPSLTGEGRFLALNMFDAKAQCSTNIIQNQNGRPSGELVNPFLGIGFRIGCDPYLYFTHLKQLCAKNPGLEYSLFMQIRGNHDLFYPVVISEPNMCREDIQYTWWKRNSWIQIPENGPAPSSVSLLSLFQ